MQSTESNIRPMYAPLIKSARRVREHLLSPEFGAVLLTDIEPDERQQVRYAHLLVVFRRGLRDPVAFISAEVAAPDAGASGTHFLCAFLPTGRRNFGAQDIWGDLLQFERGALQVARQVLVEV